MRHHRHRRTRHHPTTTTTTHHRAHTTTRRDHQRTRPSRRPRHADLDRETRVEHCGSPHPSRCHTRLVPLASWFHGDHDTLHGPTTRASRGALVVPRLRSRRTPLRPTGPPRSTARTPADSGRTAVVARSIAITVRRRRRYNGQRVVNVRTPCASPTCSSADVATPPVARSRCAARSPVRRARGETGTSGSCQMFPGHVARARNSVA